MTVCPEIFTYPLYKETLERLRKSYPPAEFEVIGRSWAGRALFALSLGSGTEKVLFLSGLRGREKESSAALLRFFERLCEALCNDLRLCAVKIKSSFQSRRITVVPCLNPDGMEITGNSALQAGCYAGLVARAAAGEYSGWEANARSVDLARNFGYRHGETACPEVRGADSSPSGYGGPSPESETEVQALVRLCDRENFRCAFLLRDGGDEKIHPGAARAEGCDPAMMARVLSSVSGFPLCRREESESAGSFCEWFAESYKRPALEIRMRRTPGPALPETLEKNYKRVEEMLTLGAIM